MPEHRPVPYKFLPRMGVAFGDLIPPDKIIDALKVLHRQEGSSLLPTVAEYPTARPPSGPGLSSTIQIGGWMENRDAIVQAGGGAMLELEDTEKRAQMIRFGARLQPLSDELSRIWAGKCQVIG